MKEMPQPSKMFTWLQVGFLLFKMAYKITVTYIV